MATNRAMRDLRWRVVRADPGLVLPPRCSLKMAESIAHHHGAASRMRSLRGLERQREQRAQGKTEPDADVRRVKLEADPDMKAEPECKSEPDVKVEPV